MKIEMKHTKQAGFTLIELVIVIIILGVLAAVALPKFVSLNKDARIASLNNVRGAMSSAAALAHSKYLVTSPSPTTIDAEGATVTFATIAASGYPKADSGFVAATGLSATDYTQIAAGSAATANSPATSATETAVIPISVAGSPAGLSCYVKYAEPASATTAPVVTVVSTSC
jgi:MSHA pilin protein MshA